MYWANGGRTDLGNLLSLFEPEGWADRIHQYYDEQAARPRRPVLVPTLVLAAMS